jgi:hypothetical protein
MEQLLAEQYRCTAPYAAPFHVQEQADPPKKKQNQQKKQGKEPLRTNSQRHAKQARPSAMLLSLPISGQCSDVTATPIKPPNMVSTHIPIIYHTPPPLQRRRSGNQEVATAICCTLSEGLAFPGGPFPYEGVPLACQTTKACPFQAEEGEKFCAADAIAFTLSSLSPEAANTPVSR